MRSVNGSQLAKKSRGPFCPRSGLQLVDSGAPRRVGSFADFLKGESLRVGRARSIILRAVPHSLTLVRLSRHSMKMQDRKSWRYAADERLMTELRTDLVIASRLRGPSYQHARNSNRLRLLAGAVMVEPDLLPHLAVAVNRLQTECEVVGHVECYVFSSPEINAFVGQGRKRTIVGLSSAAVNHLDADELMFVLGHEFGHAAFGHLDLCAGQLIEDPELGPPAKKRLRAWQRASEISADRAGLVMAGSLEPAARALFKVASGIVSSAIPESPERFASQWQRFVEEVVREGGREFHHCSHPFPSLRMRAMCEFFQAFRVQDSAQALSGVDGNVDRMLATMDPGASLGPLGDPMFADLFFWGGLYLVGGTAGLASEERDRLATVAPPGTDIDAVIESAQVNLGACRDRFREALQERQRRLNGMEIHKVLIGILYCAFSQGRLVREREELLFELAEMMGVQKQNCERVISQYKKERSV